MVQQQKRTFFSQNRLLAERLRTGALVLAMACAGCAAAASSSGVPAVISVAHEAFAVTQFTKDPCVAVRKVSFLRSNNIVLVGNLFLPPGFDSTKHYRTILVVHPAGSVKEQSAGLYAYELARRGFVTLAYDSSYAGESGGTPYAAEMPYERVEDIRWAIDYLTTLPFVDERAIGALGICAGGGYVINAAQTERRIAALAGVSAVDIGVANRRGWLNQRTLEEQVKLLEELSALRTKEARGQPLEHIYMCPTPDETTAPSFREGYDYYRTSRAFHPRADNRFLRRSQTNKMAFSAVENIELLTQPVLLVVGSRADSDWQTERFMKRMPGKNKAVFKIKGASHIDLYDKPQYTEPAAEALARFFKKAL